MTDLAPPTLYMTKGLPASGKSTWAKKYILDRTAGDVVRVNKDCLRYMLNADRHKGKTERVVLDARDNLVRLFLGQAKTVIVDDTNFNPIHEKRLRAVADEFLAHFQVIDFTDVPLDECIRRDLKRERTVGEKVIRDMWKQYLRPLPGTVAWDPKLPDVYIVDIDGTVAINRTRGWYDWSRVGEDSPNEPVIDLVQSFVRREPPVLEDGSAVMFVSGRDGICEAETRSWLGRYLGLWTKDSQLHMRPVDDRRPDTVVKKEIYQKYIEGRYNVRLVLDDRNSVVEMWRGLGLTCLQVAEGNF
jgi:predicted kinase